MLVIDVKEAFKSVATTCDGNVGGECHVLFTKHSRTMIIVGDMGGSYTVGKTGIGSTCGMEAWVFVGHSDKASEGFVRPVAAP